MMLLRTGLLYFTIRTAESQKPGGDTFTSTREISMDYWKHPAKHFAQLLRFYIEEFDNYLADSPSPEEVRADNCNVIVTKRVIITALKQVGRNKSHALDGRPKNST